jgi:hypothetical protein
MKEKEEPKEPKRQKLMKKEGNFHSVEAKRKEKSWDQEVLDRFRELLIQQVKLFEAVVGASNGTLRLENGSDKWILELGSGNRRAPYLFDFRRINIYFLFCRTNSVRDLIFV